MRFVVPAAALALLALPAFAQTSTAPAPAAPAATTAAPAAAAPATKAATKPVHVSWTERHFKSANKTHDGHLTKDQATAAKWTTVSKNFDAIDKDHQGFVTLDEVRGYYAAQHAAHKTAKPAKAPAATTTKS
jgi:phosphate-selective porin